MARLREFWNEIQAEQQQPPTFSPEEQLQQLAQLIEQTQRQIQANGAQLAQLCGELEDGELVELGYNQCEPSEVYEMEVENQRLKGENQRLRAVLRTVQHVVDGLEA